jgi:hypothetical protein
MRAGVLLFALLASAQPAWAQGSADYVRNVEVIAFDDAGKLYGLRVDVRGGSKLVAVRDAVTGERVKDIPTRSQAEEEKAMKILRRKYGISKNAVEGQTSPDGRLTIMGAPAEDAQFYRILVLDGSRLGELERVKLSHDKKTKSKASAIMKQVVWTKDGKRLIVVLNEKYTGKRSSHEVDRAIPLRFRKWKIRWIRDKKQKP